jgi:hypothetical protein
MNIDKKLTKRELDDKLLFLIHTANQSGYAYDDGDFIKSEKEDNKVFVINIRGCTLGRGESLGNYKVYDKMFKFGKDNFIDTVNSIKKNKPKYSDVIENILMWSDGVQDNLLEYRFIDSALTDFYDGIDNDLIINTSHYFDYDTKPLEDDSVFEDCYLCFVLFGDDYNIEIQILEVDEDAYNYYQNVYFESKPINGGC